jgi:hypothetical protein
LRAASALDGNRPQVVDTQKSPAWPKRRARSASKAPMSAVCRRSAGKVQAVLFRSKAGLLAGGEDMQVDACADGDRRSLKASTCSVMAPAFAARPSLALAERGAAFPQVCVAGKLPDCDSFDATGASRRNRDTASG